MIRTNAIFLATLILASCTHLKREPAGVKVRTYKNHFVQAKDLVSNKKTVCAMTMNSDNEIRAFQRNLPPDKFQFVELVTPKNDDWIALLDGKNIKCDILVLSSHFAEDFWGTNGSASLSDFQKASEKNSYAGIFHTPKEVFLFGCNMLADKDIDSRSPQRYREVLMSDGFSPEEASRVAALRYSPIGQTFYGQISRLFAGVPRIYGFTSASPLGPDIERSLEKYLQSIPDYASYLEQVDDGPNLIFKKTLGQFSVEQAKGHPNVEGHAQPAAYLADPQISDIEKIRWISKTLKDPNQRLVYLLEISNYLVKRRTSSANRFQIEKEIAGLSNDVELRDYIRKILNRDLEEFPELRLSLLKISRYFGWLDAEGEEKMKAQVIQKYFTQGDMTPNRGRFICSMRPVAQKYLTADLIRSVTKNGAFMSVITCLRPEDPQILLELVDVLRSSAPADGRGIAFSFFREIKPKNRDVILKMLDVLDDPDPISREFTVTILADLDDPIPEVRGRLMDLQKVETNRFVKEKLSSTLNMKP